MHSKKQPVTLVALILAGEIIFFLPFVLVRIFRPTLLHVFHISNTELGTYFSAYGIVAIISYFLGGPLADRFSARNLMTIALWLTALGGFFMSFIPGAKVMVILYAFWGMTTILLFWAAMIRATREWGGTGFQGRAFGWLESGRGFTAALIGTFSLIFFSYLMPSENSAVITGQKIHAFRMVILSTSIVTLLCGILIWLFVPKYQNNNTAHDFKVSEIKRLASKPSVWLLSVIIICAYIGYKITDDFSLYAHDVLGFNDINAAGVGTAALWVRGLVAIIAGIVADKLKSSTVITFCFVCSTLGGLLTGLGILGTLTGIIILYFLVIMTGIYGVRALYFALIDESGIPVALTGTVVGIVSVVGFTPDVFMSPLMGYLLDKNPGVTGHQHVFLVLAMFSAIGLGAGLLFRRTANKPSDKTLYNQ